MLIIFKEFDPYGATGARATLGRAERLALCLHDTTPTFCGRPSREAMWILYL